VGSETFSFADDLSQTLEMSTSESCYGVQFSYQEGTTASRVQFTLTISAQLILNRNAK